MEMALPSMVFLLLIVNNSLLFCHLQQRLPMRILEVMQFGSLGSGTSTRSRSDVDLILLSPGKWG